MSSAPLPEDPARWPRDPFQLLGVSPGCSPRELRRAYTNLIRTWKPEQFPEQFRRIREAYESLLRFGELFGVPRGQPPGEPQPAPAQTGPPAQSFPRSPEREPPEAVWQMALSGEEKRAYTLLAEWARTAPGRPDVALPLYWLLSLYPELDDDRSPCDWLAEGLRASGLAGPAAELYRRELEENPGEAASERCTGLLACPARPGQLARFAVWRAQGLADRANWELIRADFERLREHLPREDEPAWLEYLFGLADALAWHSDEGAEDLRAECDQEVYLYEHLAGQSPQLFDRYDLLCDLSAGWQKMYAENPLLHEFLRLIRRSWLRPFAEVRPDLEQFLATVSLAPREWLNHFSRLQLQAPTVLAQFGQLLNHLQAVLEWGPTPVEQGTMVERELKELFWKIAGANDPEDRVLFLTFCLHESVAPELLAEFVLEESQNCPGHAHSFCRAIRDDWALRLVWRAHQLFWA